MLPRRCTETVLTAYNLHIITPTTLTHNHNNKITITIEKIISASTMRGSDWMGVAMLSHVTMIIAIMSLRWYYQHNTSKACEESQYFSWKAPEQHAVYLETKEGLTARAKGHTLCEFLWLGSVPTVSWAGSMAPESWVLCFGCWIYAFFSSKYFLFFYSYVFLCLVFTEYFECSFSFSCSVSWLLLFSLCSS